jgi:hypothetical protein
LPDTTTADTPVAANPTGNRINSTRNIKDRKVTSSKECVPRIALYVVARMTRVIEIVEIV